MQILVVTVNVDENTQTHRPPTNMRPSMVHMHLCLINFCDRFVETIEFHPLVGGICTVLCTAGEHTNILCNMRRVMSAMLLF